MTLTVRALLVAGTLAIAPATSAMPQDACTYDTCALRVAGRTILRGISSESVSKPNFLGFVRALPLFEDRADSAAYYYRHYRSAANTSSSLFMIGLIPATILGVGAVVDPDAQLSDALAIGLVASITVSFGAGLIVGLRAPDRLSRAVWWYNRTLRPSGLP